MRFHFGELPHFVTRNDELLKLKTFTMKVLDNYKGYVISTHVIPFKEGMENDYEIRFQENRSFNFKLIVFF